MNQKSKFLIATIYGMLLSTSAFAQTEPPRTYGSITVQKNGDNGGGNYQNAYGNSEEDIEDISGTDNNGYMGNTPKEPSRADRLRAMEDEVSQKVNPNAKNDATGQQERSPEEFAQQEGIKTAQTDPKDEEATEQKPAPKVIVTKKKTGIVYGSISDLNTQTIQYIENEARQKDAASYQEFLKESYKK